MTQDAAETRRAFDALMTGNGFAGRDFADPEIAPPPVKPRLAVPKPATPKLRRGPSRAGEAIRMVGRWTRDAVVLGAAIAAVAAYLHLPDDPGESPQTPPTPGQEQLIDPSETPSLRPSSASPDISPLP